MTGHVLSKFSKDELPLLQESFEKCADAVECVLREGFVMAMTKFNPSEKNQKAQEAVAPGIHSKIE